MAKRPDKQVKLQKIREELIRGVSQWEIILKLQNGEYEWWPESKEVAGVHLKEAVTEALDTCQYESMLARDAQKSLHLERYLDLYKECRERGDRMNARSVLSDIAKLMGLNAPAQVKIEETNYRVKLV